LNSKTLLLLVKTNSKCSNNKTYYNFTYNVLKRGYWLGLWCLFQQYFSNIVWSVLLVEETRVSRENHWPVTSHWQTLSHNVVSSTPHYERDSNSQF